MSTRDPERLEGQCQRRNANRAKRRAFYEASDDDLDMLERILR